MNKTEKIAICIAVIIVLILLGFIIFSFAKPKEENPVDYSELNIQVTEEEPIEDDDGIYLEDNASGYTEGIVDDVSLLFNILPEDKILSLNDNLNQFLSDIGYDKVYQKFYVLSDDVSEKNNNAIFYLSIDNNGDYIRGIYSIEDDELSFSLTSSINETEVDKDSVTDKSIDNYPNKRFEYPDGFFIGKNLPSRHYSYLKDIIFGFLSRHDREDINIAILDTSSYEENDTYINMTIQLENEEHLQMRYSFASDEWKIEILE